LVVGLVVGCVARVIIGLVVRAIVIARVVGWVRVVVLLLLRWVLVSTEKSIN
jgi:hypothetical protein